MVFSNCKMYLCRSLRNRVDPVNIYDKTHSVPRSEQFGLVGRKDRLPSIEFRTTALIQYTALLTNKSRYTIPIRELIEFHNVTILFYGSPRSRHSVDVVAKLKGLAVAAETAGRTLAIVYIPLFTDYEGYDEIERDFDENHGNWWMMRYMSDEATEATLMHDISDVNKPAVVIVDRHGLILAEIEHQDFTYISSDVLDKWF
uniref:Thioredoxin-like fold domain-containing protein n=1 Tax=Graphocephala atropunctata TaxID=36148 RepID=A0A1B6MCI9_9HEMI